MSANAENHSHTNHEVRFEQTDVATRPILLAVTVLSAFAIVFTIIAYVVFWNFAGRERAASPEPSPLASRPAAAPSVTGVIGDFGAGSQQFAVESAQQVPEPRLQVDPKKDLEVLRAAEDKTLRTLAWVDKGAGVVQVPIERAMQMLAARGLPSRQVPVPARFTKPGVAPSQGKEGSGAPDWQCAEAEGADGAASHGDSGQGDAPKGHGH